MSGVDLHWLLSIIDDEFGEPVIFETDFHKVEFRLLKIG